MIHTGGSLADYRSTLARLAPLVEAADTIVPGHGAPNDRETALRILDEDVDYLDALERGEEKPALPKGRDSGEQRDIHARNLKVLGGAVGSRPPLFGLRLHRARHEQCAGLSSSSPHCCYWRPVPRRRLLSSPSPSASRTAATTWPASACV